MSNETIEQHLLFETWVKAAFPSHWPNPHEDGTYHRSDGQYHNATLNLMWCAWCASSDQEAIWRQADEARFRSLAECLPKEILAYVYHQHEAAKP